MIQVLTIENIENAFCLMFFVCLILIKVLMIEIIKNAFFHGPFSPLDELYCVCKLDDWVYKKNVFSRSAFTVSTRDVEV